jgi:hypothetical protein
VPLAVTPRSATNDRQKVAWRVPIAEQLVQVLLIANAVALEHATQYACGDGIPIRGHREDRHLMPVLVGPLEENLTVAGAPRNLAASPLTLRTDWTQGSHDAPTGRRVEAS